MARALQQAAAALSERLMNMDNPKALRPVTSDALSGDFGFRHGFFTREGGVSTGIYSGLNAGLGSSDDPVRVAENRTRIAAWLDRPGAPISTPHQIHSADTIVIDEPFRHGERPKADAIATAMPGVVVGVLTADCGPVLFADPKNGVVAAAHAGWKGAIGGILESAVETMLALGAERSAITAVLGPTIGPANYEVGPEFRARFVDADSANDRYFAKAPRDGHFTFDLPAFIRSRLEAAGVNTHDVGLCTYADEGRFYSYRRTTHRNEPDYGRQISAIVLDR
jgi:YfiH family protein